MVRGAWIAAVLLFGCGTDVDLGGAPDGSLDAATLDAPLDDAADAALCGALSPPARVAPCVACDRTKSGCQANGCFNDYYCDAQKRDCHPPPASCAEDARAPLDATGE